MPKSHSEKVLINTGSGLAVKLVDQLMKFILKTVFIYTLGIQYTGVSTLFADILNMLALAELGIGHAISFALYKPIRDHDGPRIAALMNFYKKAYRMIAGFVLVAGIICIPFLPYMVRGTPDIQENIAFIFTLYIINNASSYLLVYKSTLLTASERRYVISKVNMVFSVVGLAVECAVLLIFRNFIVYLLVGILESLLRNYVTSRKADKYFPELTTHCDVQLERQETRRLLGDVGALALYRMCTIVLNSTDSIVISAAPSLGVVKVGYLGNYRLLVNTVEQVVSQFFFSLTPSLGTVAIRNSRERQFTVFKTMNFVTFWCAAFCSASLLSLSTPFIRDIWLGKSFQMPFSIPFVLVLNFFISVISRPCNTVRNANGLFKEGYWRPVVMTVLNLGLDIALVGSLGVVGVLLATSFSRLCTQVWYDPWLIYRRVFERSYWSYVLDFTLYTVVSVAACALTFGACLLVNGLPHPYLRFLIKMVICLIVPNALFVLCFFKTAVFADFMVRLKQMLGHFFHRRRAA